MKVKLLLEKAAEYAEKAADVNPGSVQGARWVEISNLYIKMAEVLAGFETA